MIFLKIIFLVLLFIFPFGEISRFQFSNGIAFTLNDIFVVLTVVVWFLQRFFKRNGLKMSLLKPIVIFAGFGLLSLIINILNLNPSQFLISFLYLVRWILYAGIYFVVGEFDLNFKQRIPIFMIFSGLVVVLIGYAQYFLYPSLQSLYYLGWDEHLYRMFSSFLDPNFLGIFLVLLFILITSLFFNALKIKEKKLELVMMLLGVIVLIAIFLTYSRSAYIALLIGMFILLTLENKKRWILGFLVISIFVFILSSKNFYIENLNLFRTASSKARLDSSLNALKIIEKNPILGVGFNAYRYTQIRYGFRGDQIGKISHADAGTDNSFLFVLATTGILGFAAYLYLLFAIFKKSFANFKSALLISSLVSLIVGSLFINALFYPFLMEWMWILLGLTENK